MPIIVSLLEAFEGTIGTLDLLLFLLFISERATGLCFSNICIYFGILPIVTSQTTTIIPLFLYLTCSGNLFTKSSTDVSSST